MAENNEMFEQYNEYPKNIDFDAGIMKKNAAKMLGMAAGISVLMVVLTFLMNEPIFYLLRRFGVGCVVGGERVDGDHLSAAFLLS